MRREYESLVDREKIYRRIMYIRMIPVFSSFLVLFAGVGAALIAGPLTVRGSIFSDLGLFGWLALLFGGFVWAGRRETVARQYKLSGEEVVFLHTYRALEFFERFGRKGLGEWKKNLARELELASEGLANWTAGRLSIMKDMNNLLGSLSEGFKRSILPAVDKGNTDQLSAVQEWLRSLAGYLLDPTLQELTLLNTNLTRLTSWPPNGITTRKRIEDWFAKRTWVRYPISVIVGLVVATIIFELDAVEFGASPAQALTPAVAGLVGIIGIVVAASWPSKH